MSDAVGVYLDRVELFKARLKREPYVVAIVAAQNRSAGEPTDIAVQTEPMKGVDRGSALQLFSRALMAPRAAPGELGVALVVMESDAGWRRLGETIEAVSGELRGTGLGRALVAGAGLGGAVGPFAGLALDILAARLSSNGDDELLRSTCSFTTPGVSYLENDRCRVTLRCASDAATCRLDGFTTPGQLLSVRRLDQVATIVPGHGYSFGTVIKSSRKRVVANIVTREGAGVQYFYEEDLERLLVLARRPLALKPLSRKQQQDFGKAMMGRTNRGE